MNKSHQFSIEEREDVYYLLDNGEPVATPNGNIACTKSKELAGMLVKNANATKGSYTKSTDCYATFTLRSILRCSGMKNGQKSMFNISRTVWPVIRI